MQHIYKSNSLEVIPIRPKTSCEDVIQTSIGRIPVLYDTGSSLNTVGIKTVEEFYSDKVEHGKSITIKTSNDETFDVRDYIDVIVFDKYRPKFSLGTFKFYITYADIPFLLSNSLGRQLGFKLTQKRDFVNYSQDPRSEIEDDNLWDIMCGYPQPQLYPGKAVSFCTLAA